MYQIRCYLLQFVILSIAVTSGMAQSKTAQPKDTAKYDRDYALEATMLGFFAKDGSRNPTLKANKGDRVRITITNGELMTHDIALEKLGIKSKVIIEKGTSTSIIFKAEQSDTYYCSVPGHRAAGMVGSFEVVEVLFQMKRLPVQLPVKDGQPLNLGF
jgi:plastocyanin